MSNDEEFKHVNCPDCDTAEEDEDEDEEEDEDGETEEDVQARFDAASEIVDEEMSKIEEAFQELCARAAEISEEHGIPIEFAGERYVPESMTDHFGDGEDVYDMFDDEISHYSMGRLPRGEWWAWNPSTC